MNFPSRIHWRHQSRTWNSPITQPKAAFAGRKGRLCRIGTVEPNLEELYTQYITAAEAGAEAFDDH